MSYGRLANTHLIQKYGFCERDNPEKWLAANLPYRDLESILYEESKLKTELSKKLGISFNLNILPCVLHPDKFNPETLR